MKPNLPLNQDYIMKARRQQN